jgi:hypothetical protein
MRFDIGLCGLGYRTFLAKPVEQYPAAGYQHDGRQPERPGAATRTFILDPADRKFRAFNHQVDREGPHHYRHEQFCGSDCHD